MIVPWWSIFAIGIFIGAMGLYAVIITSAYRDLVKENLVKEKEGKHGNN